VRARERVDGREEIGDLVVVGRFRCARVRECPSKAGDGSANGVLGMREPRRTAVYGRKSAATDRSSSSSEASHRSTSHHGHARQ